MMNSERPKAPKREDGVDLISSMPDPILHVILSSLRSTEDAIRTSVLSKRWRYLWTSVPSLYIDCFRGCKDQKNFKKDKFKEFVYWVLVNKTFDLDSFQLSCSDYYCMSTVGRWIHAAVTRNVKQLDLSFCSKDDTVGIDLPHCLVTCSSLTKLRLDLEVCILRFPDFKWFPALRVLNLTRVYLEDDVLVQEVFESCPVLEHLALFDVLICMLNVLCISCPKLKKLSIINVNVKNYTGYIKISCPKLADLVLTGPMGCNFFFECLDSLNTAVIQPKLEYNTTKSVLFPGLSHVETLLIDLYFLSQCITAECDPALPNLKNLVLTTTIDSFTFDEFIFILKYYPKVESLKFIIKEEFDGSDKWDEHKGYASRILITIDLKRVVGFEYNGAKPKLVSD